MFNNIFGCIKYETAFMTKISWYAIQYNNLTCSTLTILGLLLIIRFFLSSYVYSSSSFTFSPPHLFSPPPQSLSLLLVCFLLVLIHLFIYPSHSVLDTVIDNILDLEFIFMISMMFSQMPEFLYKHLSEIQIII